jgi:Tfp pilus assembly protein PilV
VTARIGTSFIEVLVASVLLAVGIVGCLSTLAAAARLRHGASVREELAARAHDRLGWFVVRGCTVSDTAFASPDSAKVRDDWEQHRDSLRSHLSLQLSAPSSAMVHRVALSAELPCP